MSLLRNSAFAVLALQAVKFAQATKPSIASNTLDLTNSQLEELFGSELGDIVKCQTCGVIVRKVSDKLAEETV